MNPNKHLLLLLLICLQILVYGQFNSKTAYRIIIENEYNQKNTAELNSTLKKYIPISYDLENYHHAVKSKNPDSVLFCSFYCFGKGKFWKIRKIMKLNSEVSTTPIIRALYCIFHAQFKDAYNCLNQYEGNDYVFLRELLLADCFYESNKFNYDDDVFVEKYQKVINLDINNIQKEIINHRIKLIKYRM